MKKRIIVTTYGSGLELILFLVSKSIKERLIILMPLVWSYRNIFLSGLYDQLRQIFDIYFAIPEVALYDFSKLGISEDKIIILQKAKESKFHRIVCFILSISHENKYNINTGAIFSNFKQKNDNRDSFIISLVNTLLIKTFKIPFLFKVLQNIEEQLYLKVCKAETEKILLSIKPFMLLSTANVAKSEWPLFRVAQSLGINTVSHILSFDNITSRGYLPIGKFKYYLVWNEQMKSELINIYQINPRNIFLTGTPQFDFHINYKHIWSKDKTLSRLGFQKHTNYILYCANHNHISPNEPILLNEVVNAIKGKYKDNIKIVLRLHPMDDYKRWNDFLSDNKDIVVSKPWPHDKSNEFYWGKPTIEDLEYFSNILRYSSVMLNIASTVSIDAAIVNTPIICIGFHPNNYEESIFYHDLHYSNHYQPILDTEATPLANNTENLMKLIEEDISNRTLRSKQRKKLAEKYLPSTTQMASNQIVNFFLSCSK